MMRTTNTGKTGAEDTFAHPAATSPLLSRETIQTALIIAIEIQCVSHYMNPPHSKRRETNGRKLRTEF